MTCVTAYFEGLPQVYSSIIYRVSVHVVPTSEIEERCLHFHTWDLVVLYTHQLTHMIPLIENRITLLIILDLKPHSNIMNICIVDCKVPTIQTGIIALKNWVNLTLNCSYCILYVKVWFVILA